MHDITKLLDDISLDDLLDGHYESPSLGKEKGKKAAHVNVDVLQTVRKAFTILQRRVSSHVKQYNVIDFSSEHNILPLPSTSNICVTSSLDGEEENHLPSASATYTKESGDKTKASSGESKAPQQLYHPKVVLERLAISLTKDLDLLLQDAATAVSSSRCNDLPHTLKIASPQQVSLPSFSRSHNHNNGHHNNKSNTDSTAKVSKKSTCQGKWLRVGERGSVHGSGADDRYSLCLQSLPFSPSLVPSGSVKYILPEIEKRSSTSVGPSGSITASKASKSLSDPPCPSSLLAAQTLFDIARKSAEDPTSGELMKLPQLPSGGKSMKVRKFTSIATHEELPSSIAKSSIMMLNNEPIYPISKKSKLESVDTERNAVPSNGRNGYFSAPKSSRSSPSRSERDFHHPPTIEANHNKRRMSSNFSKQQLISPPLPPAPPPPRFFDTKNSNSSHRQQKPRKVGQIDWNNRERS